MANAVQPEVEMGFHLCYGDSGHQHFMEPVSTKVMVDVANAIMEGANRPVQWFHMPVPKSRDDLEYFAPLRELNLQQGIVLYLGLVHANDYEGTIVRIEAAEQVGLGSGFGVATECGMGRTPSVKLDSVFQILNRVSKSVT